MKQQTRNIKKTTKQTIKQIRNQKEMKKAAKKRNKPQETLSTNEKNIQKPSKKQ